MRIALTAAAVSMATPVSAEWKEARTRHFTVYSEMPRKELESYVTRLEQFDGVVREIQGSKDPEPTTASRLTVYVVKSADDVQRLIGIDGVAGFYNSSAESTLAVVPEHGTPGGQWALSSDAIFFHEYAHHLMLQNLDVLYPRWLIEGYAEFLATVQFEKDGNLRFGRSADHRMYELMLGMKLPYERLLTNELIKSSDPGYTSFYGRSWILTHFFMFTPDRQKQLVKYLTLLNQNVSGRQAAEQAFGNLDRLSGQVESYFRKPSLPYSRFDAAKYAPKSIAFRTLRPGEAAVFPARIQSKVGVDKKKGARVLEEVRKVAAAYPSDPIVLASLAEAELDMENYAAAYAAADRALAADPQSVEARIYKGRALTWNPANKGKSEPFEEARALFIAANKVDTEDPEPLKYYWESYRRQGAKPTANAAAALHYASQLVPQDTQLRVMSAWQYLQDGKLQLAHERLAVIAASPHEGKKADQAQDALEKISANDGPGAIRIVQLMLARPDEAKEGKKDD